MSRKLSNIDFINKANIIHNNKYNYSEVNYIKSNLKVCIICNTHGQFYQTPSMHLFGNGCPKCAGNIKYDTNSFINKANKVHNKLYDYSKVEYTTNKDDVIIICRIHGIFTQNAGSHLSGQGCPKCRSNYKSNIFNFINKANKKHNNIYDYSKVIYINDYTKVHIICKKHGLFTQKPNDHLQGHGCPLCAIEISKNNRMKKLDIFINDAKKIHNNFYKYSNIEYINNKTKIDIECPIHGIFKQTPSHHLNGQGCPKCNESKGEQKIRNYLIYRNIDFIPQYKINECKYKQVLIFDFFIPNINILIEYDGIQHFKPIDIFGGIDQFKKTKKRDTIKNKFVKNSKYLKIIRIKYSDYDKIDEILDSFLQKIKQEL